MTVSSGSILLDRRHAGAIGVLLLATAWVFSLHLDMSFSRGVLYRSLDLSQNTKGWSHAETVDQRFVIWLISRNARTWLASPWRMHDGEICHPAEQSIALGEPALTQGLVATPAWLATRDPIATYNFAIVATVLAGALAMYLLIVQWTGSPPAGLLAAILYGFHPLKITDPIHFYVADTAWTVWALLLFQRFLETGRWRHLVGLGMVCSLQIGGSLYPLIAAAAVGSPFAAWAVLRFGLRQTKPIQWIVLAGWIGLPLAFAFSPYLEKTSSDVLHARAVQFFAQWSELIGGSAVAWGLRPLLPVFAVGALALPRAFAKVGPPGLRFALLAGGLLCLWLATGGNAMAVAIAEHQGVEPPIALPNLFAGLATFVPGLNVIRIPMQILHGVLIPLACLAALGVHAISQKLPPRRRAPYWAAVIVVFGVITLKPIIGDGPELEVRDMRPADATLRFYDALDAAQDRGPIVELPYVPIARPEFGTSILEAAYHRRRIAACYNSYRSKEVDSVRLHQAALPGSDAIDALAAMGFTTVVLRTDVNDARGQSMEPLYQAFVEEGQAPGGRVRLVHEAGPRSAWSLRPSGASSGDRD